MLLTLSVLIDEQDEYVRQIDELKEKTANKQNEIGQLQNELTEMTKVNSPTVRIQAAFV